MSIGGYKDRDCDWREGNVWNFHKAFDGTCEGVGGIMSPRLRIDINREMVALGGNSCRQAGAHIVRAFLRCAKENIGIEDEMEGVVRERGKQPCSNTPVPGIDHA